MPKTVGLILNTKPDRAESSAIRDAKSSWSSPNSNTSVLAGEFSAATIERRRKKNTSRSKMRLQHQSVGSTPGASPPHAAAAAAAAVILHRHPLRADMQQRACTHQRLA
jgi:hypothetical protein